MISSMDELTERVQRQIYRMQDLRDQLTRMHASATSDDGAVTVAVDGNGALTGLDLSADIARMTPTEFEQALVSTAARAVQQVFAQRSDLVTEFNEQAREGNHG